MHAITREAVQRLVRVIFRMAVPRRGLHQLAERIRAVVSEEKEERPCLVACIEKLHRLARPEIRRVAGLDAQRAVFDHLLIVKLFGAPIRLRRPRREALARLHVRAEMPLAAQRAVVAAVMQHLAEAGELPQRVVGLRSHHHRRRNEGMHAMLRWDEPGEKRRACGRAHRIAAQRTREAHALRG